VFLDGYIGDKLVNVVLTTTIFHLSDVKIELTNLFNL
jgi:hypothetical protein